MSRCWVFKSAVKDDVADTYVLEDGEGGYQAFAVPAGVSPSPSVATILMMLNDEIGGTVPGRHGK